MVLIVSKSTDRTASDVIGWLHKSGYRKVFRITEDSDVTIKKINIDNTKNNSVNATLSINSQEFATSDLNFFWYRNGDIIFNHNKPLSSEAVNLNTYLGWEEIACRNFLVRNFQNKSYLGNFFRASVNKLEMLLLAKEVGFDVPETIIGCSLDSFTELDKSKKWITKPIREALPISEGVEYIRLHTEEVNHVFLEQQKKFFFPSLLQERIEKWLELRVCVLYQEIYAMAIFSQNNDATQTDYRNYDFSNMNRMIPYQLPNNIKEKVLLFMERSGLNTGSLDLIVTKEKNYFFLEVNPAGNIEMVSDNCNYKIEKRIAKQILEEENNGK